MCQFRRFSLERPTVHEKPGKQPPTPVTQTVPSRRAPTKHVTDNVPSKHADASNLALSLGEDNFPQQVGKQRPTSVTQTELEENNGPRRQGKQHQASVTRHLANKYAPLTGNHVDLCRAGPQKGPRRNGRSPPRSAAALVACPACETML